jgi:hypothetical protein
MSKSTYRKQPVVESAPKRPDSDRTPQAKARTLELRAARVAKRFLAGAK